jgi:hypothetical protein
MQFQHLTSPKGAFWLLGSLALTACSSTSHPSPTPSVGSVDSAYAALVGEFANCAKEVKSCVDAAAGDSAALAACRDEFASCRESAGEHAASAIATAVRSCTEQQNACVKAAHGSAAGSCHEDLVMCLGAAHAANGHDDEDGGVDERGGGKSNGDCLQTLRACVEADGPAKACAEEVRSCVSETMPNAGEVVPEDDSAGDDDSAEEADESPSPADGHGRDAGADNAHENPSGAHEMPADVGAKGQAAMTAARQCVDSFASCVDAGSSPRSCVMALKQCHSASK